MTGPGHSGVELKDGHRGLLGLSPLVGAAMPFLGLLVGSRLRVRENNMVLEAPLGDTEAA